ncbi:5' nucleotidase, NT5C type [Paenibacillus solani]|uniref:5' nucleotidase, NT5C type n=1 Tax=Paenibacillus solani TaxID=1705565 RepID=UPI003D2B6E90
MKKTLLIDMDSVLANLMKEWFERYNKDYGDNLTIDRAYDWNATSYVKKECGYKIYDYLCQPGIFLNLEPMPNAIDVLKRLANRFEIIIVTSPPSKYAYLEKEEWLSKYVPFIDRNNIIFSHRKELIDGDLLFDDAPHNLIQFINCNKKAVAMDYPYNRGVSCPRVSDWLEFELKIDLIMEHVSV